MTPKKKTSNSTTLKMERKRIINSSNGGDAKVHVAGGTQFNYQIEDLCFILNSSDSFTNSVLTNLRISSPKMNVVVYINCSAVDSFFKSRGVRSNS